MLISPQWLKENSGSCEAQLYNLANKLGRLNTHCKFGRHDLQHLNDHQARTLRLRTWRKVKKLALKCRHLKTWNSLKWELPFSVKSQLLSSKIY